MLFLAPYSGSAQHSIRNLTVEDGLPSTEIYYVHQDHDGYLWFCTDRGLSKYDGYEFTNYNTNDGLTYNTIFRVFEAPNHDLWFCAFNGTITIWDWTTGEFSPFLFNDSLQKMLGNYNWAHIIDFRGDSIHIYPHREETRITYYPKEQRIATKEIATNREFRILSRSDRDITMRTDRYRPAFQYVNLQDFDSEEFPDTTVLRVINEMDSKVKIIDLFGYDNRLALSTDKGLYIFESGELKSILFPQQEISCVYRDHENNFWLTTTDQGVNVMRMDEIEDTGFGQFLNIGEKVTSIASIKNYVVVGTNKGRVLDFKTGKNLLEGREVVADIHEFYKWKNKLYTSYGYVIGRNENGWTIDRPGSIKYGPKTIYRLIPLTDSTTFFSWSNMFGVARTNKTPPEVKHYEARVLSLSPTYYGTAIYSTFSGIYEVFNMDFDHPVPYNETLDLGNTTVRDIKPLKDSIMALATSGGGLILCKEGVKIAQITVKNDLASDMINHLLIDTANRRIWCTTNRGVSLLNYELNGNDFVITNISNINKLHGMVSNYISQLTMTPNDVFMASDKGVSKISRTFHLGRNRSPMVNILGLILEDSNYLMTQSVFPYNRNNIEIRYSAFSLQRPMDRAFYRYRLRKKNLAKGEWNLTNERGVRFNSLDAGSYVFEVSARSENSIWSPPASIEFQITPFILDRLPVRIMIGIFLLAGIILIVLLVIKRMKKENEKELAIKNLQLKINQMELAALRGQMNPHFIFNALKSIQKLILSDEKWGANDLLTRFSRLIRSSLEYSRMDMIPLSGELEFLRNYMEIEQKRVPDRFDFEIITNNIDDPDEMKIPALMIQPICENAVKHAFGGKYRGKIEVIFDHDPLSEVLEVTITDNGVGYYNKNGRSSSKSHSMGLDIVRSRLTLFEQQGYDTSFSISPLDPETGTGTKIKMKIPCQ